MLTDVKEDKGMLREKILWNFLLEVIGPPKEWHKKTSLTAGP